MQNLKRNLCESCVTGAKQYNIILQKLHWLALQWCKLASLTYKVLLNGTPPHLAELLNTCVPYSLH